MTQRVTLNMLADLDACGEQRDLFDQTFPADEGVEVTAENLDIAHKAWLNVDWILEKFGVEMLPRPEITLDSGDMVVFSCTCQGCLDTYDQAKKIEVHREKIFEYWKRMADALNAAIEKWTPPDTCAICREEIADGETCYHDPEGAVICQTCAFEMPDEDFLKFTEGKK